MKKIFFLLFVCILITALSGCSLEAYKFLGSSNEKGFMLDVDGITYSTNPIIPWRPISYKTKMIGVTSTTGGATQDGIYTCEGDTERIFILAEEQEANPSIDYYYRDDVVLPAFKRDSIDTVMVGRNILDKQVNTITDSKTIDMLFSILITTSKEKLEGDYYTVYDLNFINNKFKGIAVTAQICVGEGQYWLYYWNGETYKDQYFELPQDLLEELVGNKMPTASEYMAKYKK